MYINTISQDTYLKFFSHLIIMPKNNWLNLRKTILFWIITHSPTMSFHTFFIKLYFKTSLLDGKISSHISPWRIKSVKSLFQSMIVKLRSCSWPISTLIVSLKSLKSWGKIKRAVIKWNMYWRWLFKIHIALDIMPLWKKSVVFCVMFF